MPLSLILSGQKRVVTPPGVGRELGTCTESSGPVSCQFYALADSGNKPQWMLHHLIAEEHFLLPIFTELNPMPLVCVPITLLLELGRKDCLFVHSK